jgi:hypothetical protein
MAWNGGAGAAGAAGTTAIRVPVRLDVDATLADHVRLFFHERVLRIMAAVPVVAVAVRAALGNWGWSDLVVLGLLFVIFPFFEWGIHVFVLHAKPKRVLGRTIELGATRNHRDHHARPTDPSMSVADSGRNMVQFSIGIIVLAGVILRSVPLVLTVFAFAWAGVLAYEWTHYLMHSAWKPQSAWFTKRRHLHLLHHYRSEHQWFGVVAHSADVVLRTNPKPLTVPRSPTARQLGGEARAVLADAPELVDD